MADVAGCPPEVLPRLDAVARALVERARPVSIRLATSDEDVHDAQRLRGRAVVRRGWAHPDELSDGREVDIDDTRAVHLLAVVDSVTIGTARLVFPEPGRPLPIERSPTAARLPRPAVEVGRMVVLAARPVHQRAVMGALVGRAWLELRARGQCRIAGSISAPIARLFRRMGFLVQVVGPAARVFGEERFPILFEPDPQAATFAEARAGRAP